MCFCCIGENICTVGKRTIIVEVDNFSSIIPPFLKVDEATPIVRLILYGCNITWLKALEDWLERTIDQELSSK